jgi:exopolyphosphatase/guanosine-5'-triphosphate,3'-diphosphate pyrophosphatase
MAEGGARRPSRDRPIAAIDCGTNTIKLLVGTPTDAGGLDVTRRESRMIRLGQGIDRSGEIAPEALERAFAAIEEYADLVRAAGVGRIRFCATSATRDAGNAEEFAAGVEARLGVRPEVLSGEEEAATAFDGAVRNLREAPAEPVLVVDIGGGSTELVLGSGGSVDRAVSMDVGSVRMHERHLHSDPPTDAEVAACIADIEHHLDASPVPLAGAGTVVGIAGTCTTIAAGCLDLPAYDRDAIDQQVIGVVDTHAFVDRLVAATVRERLEMPFLHPGRADVIDAGALVLDRVLRRTPLTSWVVSEADILDGIAWSLVDP